MVSIRRSLALVVFGAIGSESTGEHATLTVNPIRKVVTMLQMMTNKVEAQGELEQELFDKFMCYCKTGVADLEKAIADAEEKIPSLESEIKATNAEALQLKADVPAHKADRAAAKEAIAEATAIREKEAATFAASSADLKTNTAAMAKAIAALEKGMKGGFLQTAAASTLKRITLSDGVSDSDREVLTEFLEGSSQDGYAPASGQIVGVLKQMLDTMSKDLADLTTAEEEAIKDFDALLKAKTAEIDTLQKMIEEKIEKLGKVGVEVVEMMEDLEDTKEGLVEDKKFLAELEKGCSTKEAEWAERCKLRQEELLALADTIKMLNDDDALELFKKTLPGAASFLQTMVTSEEVMARARDLLLGGKNKHRGHHDHRMDMIALMLRGKKVGFDKIIKMIDDMVNLLGEEQESDSAKKAQCEKDLDLADDKKKELERTVSNLEKAIAEEKESIATLTDEIASLVQGIEDLDKDVSERTAQRKEENSDYQTEMASHIAAKELIGMAKNRMNKFYNPKLHKAAPKRELSEDERITLNMGGSLAPTEAPGGIAGTGISAVQRDAPPPPPETFGAYSKKSEESGGVIAMMDALIKDLAEEAREMEFNEKDAQEDYEQFTKDAAEKRAMDSKSIQDKEGAKADQVSSLQENTEEHASSLKAAFANEQVIMNLHADCDWLIKYFDMRKEARTGEVEALKKAKAVLSGADYSFLQTRSSTFLRRL